MATKLVATLLAVSLAAPVLACCAIPMGPPTDDNQITLSEQRAFLYRQGTREHLVLSVQYDGGSDSFAWVIPVESRPQVDVLNGAPFTELRSMTKVVRLAQSMDGGSKGAPTAVRGVEVLYTWLKTNGFQLSKNMRGALDHYVQRDFVFVAARIRPDDEKQDALDERLRQGTIAPIHLTYEAKQLSYPLRVTAGNPGTSRLEFYVLDAKPDDYSRLGLTAQTFTLKPTGKDGFQVSGPPGAENPTAPFPTIRKLIPSGGKLTKYTGVLPDERRQEDLVFDKI